MKYKVTDKVLKIVEDLYEEGYSGQIELSNSFATGTKNVLGTSIAAIIPGFCKESLHLVEDTDTGKIVGVGRYEKEFEEHEVDVHFIVSNAWRTYKCYKDRGYSRPYEFEGLFFKYGMLKTEVETKTVVKEL